MAHGQNDSMQQTFSLEYQCCAVFLASFSAPAAMIAEKSAASRRPGSCQHGQEYVIIVIFQF